jgi:protein phosphatase
VLTFQYAVRTDPGRTHKDNEDRCFVDAAQGLFLVSDGMAEAVSSQLVVDTLPRVLAEHLAGVEDLTSPAANAAVPAALAAVSRTVRAEGRRRKDMIGATVVLALIADAQALVAHLGDSRAYLRNSGKLERLTRDHSFVQRMVDLGWITAEEALGRGNGGPTRYAGMVGEGEADVRCVELRAGDCLLLCSDGLTEMLDDEQILPLLDPRWTPEQSCERLVAAANKAGGEDNITVIVVAVS